MMTNASLLDYLTMEKNLLVKKDRISNQISTNMHLVEETDSDYYRKIYTERLNELLEQERTNEEELSRVRGYIRSYIHELFK